MPSGCILVVDDDNSVLGLVASILRGAGYTALVASSARRALETLRQAGKVDLCVTDLEMPSMNGYELARRVDAERPGTRILVVSGFSPRSEFLDPSWRFLTKPFTPAKLLNAVRECLGDDRG